MRTEKKHDLAVRRGWRIRKKISGTPERPRMSVCFSNKNIHVQFIDDTAGGTLAAASTLGKAAGELAAKGTSAKTVGAPAAGTGQEKGLQQVGFYPRKARYYGKGKAMTD